MIFVTPFSLVQYVQARSWRSWRLVIEEEKAGSLEAICRHHSTNNQYLGPGLKELRERGIIDGRLSQWAEELQKSRILEHTPPAKRFHSKTLAIC